MHADQGLILYMSPQLRLSHCTFSQNIKENGLGNNIL
jgi:hypothetical protein